MAGFKFTRKQRLIATIMISSAFFVAELALGIYTHTLCLMADAFHVLCDLIGVAIALYAVVVSERSKPPPQEYTFGWQRATLLGSFFNGVFLLALGASILVQAIDRFTEDEPVEKPFLVFIVGLVGLTLNLAVLSFLHAPPGKDLGMFGVFIHVVGDAINNAGVCAAALIMWLVEDKRARYADPAASTFIAIMIMATAIPLLRSSGAILLQIAPIGINMEDVKHDIKKTPGVLSVHELHIWRLDQHKTVASAHIAVDGRTVNSFTDTARIIMECLHDYGIHSATLQPEVSIGAPLTESQAAAGETGPSMPV
ncbi:Fc.00g090760.m01.CDS01 [Cosmosporella sp. VM-42]